MYRKTIKTRIKVKNRKFYRETTTSGYKKTKRGKSLKAIRSSFLMICAFLLLCITFSSCATKYTYLTVFKEGKNAYVFKTQNIAKADSILEQKLDIKNFATTSLNDNEFFEVRADSFYFYCENKKFKKEKTINIEPKITLK